MPAIRWLCKQLLIACPGESCGHIGHRMVSLLRITHQVLFSHDYMMCSFLRLQIVVCICFSNDDKY